MLLALRSGRLFALVLIQKLFVLLIVDLGQFQRREAPAREVRGEQLHKRNARGQAT
jgi:hypothetical protein